MVQVTLTANLQKYFPVREIDVDAHTVSDVLRKMDETRPQFSHYILEDNRRVRKHVNIFVDGKLLSDKSNIHEKLRDGCQLHIMQALSGG